MTPAPSPGTTHGAVEGSTEQTPVDPSRQMFCQLCGAGDTYEHAVKDGWLIATYRIDRTQLVVRCFRHISEWSLRVSAAGRTREWRQKMEDGRRRAETSPPPNPTTQPIVTR